MRHSIDNGLYKRKEFPDPNNDSKTIPEPISKMIAHSKAQYFADIKEYTLKTAKYDQFYDHLSQFEPHVNASRAKKATRNHDLLALVANSHVHSLNSHADTRRCSKDKLTTAMILLASAITQRYSAPTNNCLRTLSSTMNQAVIQDGRVNIQSKNVGHAWNGNKNVGRQNMNQATNAGNGLVQSIKEYDQNVQRNPITKSTLMLLATKDEAGVHLDEEENDFMLDNAYGNNTLEELYAAVIMMARIQPTDEKSDAKPTYDVELLSEVYDPHLKTGLGYENLEHLKKAIEAEPKMYNGEKLESNKLKVDLPDYEETLEDAEECSEKSDLPLKKMPNGSKLLKLFVNLDKEIKELGKIININLKSVSGLLGVGSKNKIFQNFLELVKRMLVDSKLVGLIADFKIIP
ncbi:hypothetical protein Tco_0492764 [Tanacetum coccineum]